MNPIIPTYISIHRRAQRGLSLIELMISITIGMFILASLTTLFVSQSHTRTELDKSTRMIENGRYAMEVLTDNIRLAGFYSQLDPSIIALPAVIADPCSIDPALMAGMLPLPVVGLDAAAEGSVIASKPGCLPSLKNGSDILVLRRASTAPPVPQTAAVNGIQYIQVSSCSFDALKYKVSTAPANFTLRQRICTAASTTPYADVMPLLVQSYFVSPDNNAGDGIPTLKRMELNSTGTGFIATPLVEGIEYMQVEYGVDDPTQDTDGNGVVGIDGIPDSYITCSACTISDWSNVVSAKIYFIARNIEQTPGYTDSKIYTLGQAGVFGPFNDHFKRHVYTQVVRLINPAGRREVQ